VIDQGALNSENHVRISSNETIISELELFKRNALEKADEFQRDVEEKSTALFDL